LHVYNHILISNKLATYSASVIKSNFDNFGGINRLCLLGYASRWGAWLRGTAETDAAGADQRSRLPAKRALLSCFTDVSRTITFPDRRFPDKTFPGQVLSRTRPFPDNHFPGQDVSRKEVSRTRSFPDKTFPGQSLSRTDVSRTDVSRTSYT